MTHQKIKSNINFTEEEHFLSVGKAFSSLNYSQEIMLVNGCPLVMQGVEVLLSMLPVSLSVNNLSVPDHNYDSIILNTHIDVVISGLFGDKGNSLNGFITLRKIKMLNPKVKVIIVTRTKNKRVLSFLVNMGMDAIISCDDSLDEIKRIMMYTLQNNEKRVCSQRIKGQLPHLRENFTCNLSFLTHHELMIINDLLKGYNLKKISEEASRSVKTISHYKRSAMRKLGARSDAKMLQSIQILAGQRID